MPVEPLDTKSTVRPVLFVEFVYETPSTRVRYCSAETDTVYDSNTFTSLPELEAKMPKLDGTTKGTTLELTMREVPPLNSMRGTFPPVTVKLWEIDPASPSSAFKLYQGQIARVIFNVNGNPRVVRVLVGGPKKRLESTVSLRLGRFCPWVFGSRPCRYDREGNKVPNVITAIEGTRVTFQNAISEDPGLWKNGSIRFRGFEVSIHKQDSDTVMYTTRPVPLHWLDETVDVLHGCDHTPATCQARGQIERFGGIGVKMDDRDVRISE